jgi:NO-binding membrane sensor protein with MHYT domain
MGIGIWSMHFVGMLGFSLSVPVSYYCPTVLLFFILAVLAATLALYEVSRERMGGAHNY